MIFLTLIAIGALAGAALQWLRGLPVGLAPQCGAAGAFVLGGLVAGFGDGTPGPLDPLSLAVGLAGAILLVLLLEPRGSPRDRSAHGGRRHPQR